MVLQTLSLRRLPQVFALACVALQAQTASGDEIQGR